MSKHSKWSKIKRQKAATDHKRGKAFSRLSRAIISAATTGPNPEKNLHLRTAIETALAHNMPKDTIERAIQRGAGRGTDGSRTETVILEGYGPNGSALLVVAVTERRNRVVAEVRHALQEAGGSLGEAGSTQWLFARKGRIVLEQLPDTDAAELAAIDAGADETSRTEEGLKIITKPEAVTEIANRLRSAGYVPALVDIAHVPAAAGQTAAPPDNSDHLARLIARLEALDEVVEVAANAATGKE